MKRNSSLKLWSAALVCLAVPALAADPKSTSSAGGPGAGTPSPAVETAKPQEGAKGALAKQDDQFIKMAAQSGMTEVKLGELASQKGASAKVKEFGAMMVKDHGQANQELRDLAGKKGVTLPPDLDSKHQGMVDKMSKLSGEAFDKEYADEMVSNHKKAGSEFEKASKSAADADLKAWAGKTLPTLQAHLQHAQELKKGL